MKAEADEEQIDDTIKSKLQEAYAEILDSHGIKSGDITPLQQFNMDEAEDEVVNEAVNWIKSRLNQKVRPLERDEDIGREVMIREGEYEITNYTKEGGAHSEEYRKITQPTRGMIVENVFEGMTLYNVALRSENHQRLFLLVPAESVEKV